MTRLAALLACFATLAVFAAPAEAQSRRELAQRIDRLEARMAELDDSALAGDPVAERLMQRVDALEREQRVLTGEVETLTYQNRQLRNEVERLRNSASQPFGGSQTSQSGGPAQLEPDSDGYAGEDLAVVNPDDPFAQERAAATGQLSLPGSGAGPANDNGASRGSETAGGRGPASLAGASNATLPEPATLFQNGRNRLLDGDFGGAQEQFAQFTNAYGDHELAGQAWYWLGETHFVQGDFQNAADSYLSSLQAQRQGPRAPDALVRLAASLAAMDQVAEACGVLAGFDAEFPNADEESRRKASREAARAGC
jgi:tol-pal system protein YbgF